MGYIVRRVIYIYTKGYRGGGLFAPGSAAGLSSSNDSPSASQRPHIAPMGWGWGGGGDGSIDKTVDQSIKYIFPPPFVVQPAVTVYDLKRH